jgi:hypothetical protein
LIPIRPSPQPFRSCAFRNSPVGSLRLSMMPSTPGARPATLLLVDRQTRSPAAVSSMTRGVGARERRKQLRSSEPEVQARRVLFDNFSAAAQAEAQEQEPPPPFPPPCPQAEPSQTPVQQQIPQQPEPMPDLANAQRALEMAEQAIAWADTLHELAEVAVGCRDIIGRMDGMLPDDHVSPVSPNDSSPASPSLSPNDSSPTCPSYTPSPAAWA